MRSITIICLLAISSHLFAVEKPIWENSSLENVNWISILPSGNLLAVGNAKIFCLNATNGVVLWEEDAHKELTTDDLSAIPYTNYLVVQKEMTVIINSNTGKEIVSSDKIGLISVDYYTVVYDINCLLLIGKKAEQPTVILIDLTTGQTRWEKVIESFNTEKLRYSNVLEGNELLIADNSSFLSLNIESGDVNWTYMAQAESYKSVYLRPQEDIAFLVSGAVSGYTGSCAIEGVNIRTGEIALSKIEFKGVFQDVIFEEEEVLISWSQGFNRINLETGSLDFKSDHYAMGDEFNKFLRTDKGYMIAKHYGQNYSLNYIGNDGVPIIKSIKSGYFREIGLEGDDIFIFTTSMFGLYDGSTGKKIKEKSTIVTPNFSFVKFDEKNNCYIAYSDKKLYKLDKSNFTMNILNKKVTQFNNSKPMKKMEIRETGYLIQGENEFSLIGFDGVEIYHSWYSTVFSASAFAIKPPKISFGVAGVSIAESKYSESIDKKIAERYKRDSEISNKIIIQTKLKEDGVKFIGILSIDKDSSKELKKIKILERDPIYVIDEIDNILYYKTGTNKIQSFQL